MFTPTRIDRVAPINRLNSFSRIAAGTKRLQVIQGITAILMQRNYVVLFKVALVVSASSAAADDSAHDFPFKGRMRTPLSGGFQTLPAPFSVHSGIGPRHCQGRFAPR